MSPFKGKVRLNGQLFEVVSENSVERELYWTDLVRRGGLDFDRPNRGESLDAYRRRTSSKVFASAVFIDLVSTQLRPDGRPWTVESANKIADLVRHASKATERLAIWGLGWRVIEELFEGESFAPWEER